MKLPVCNDVKLVDVTMYNISEWPLQEKEKRTLNKQGKEFAEFFYSCCPVGFFDAFKERLAELQNDDM